MINYEQHPPTATLINKIVAYTVKQLPVIKNGIKSAHSIYSFILYPF